MSKHTQPARADALPEPPVGYLITWHDTTYRGEQTLSFDKCNEDDGDYEPVYRRRRHRTGRARE